MFLTVFTLLLKRLKLVCCSACSHRLPRWVSLAPRPSKSFHCFGLQSSPRITGTLPLVSYLGVVQALSRRCTSQTTHLLHYSTHHLENKIYITLTKQSARFVTSNTTNDAAYPLQFDTDPWQSQQFRSSTAPNRSRQKGTRRRRINIVINFVSNNRGAWKHNNEH